MKTGLAPLDDGGLVVAYRVHLARKRLFLLGAALAGVALFLASLCLGAARLSPAEALGALLGGGSERWRTIVWNIRLPNALAAALAGAGLAGTGAAMQSLLRNPLASPMTLGMAHAGAFGAACAVSLLGAGATQSTAVNAVTVFSPSLTTTCAFACCLAASLAILALGRLRGGSPEAMALGGMALGLFFQAAAMVMQYFADDAQLAAMVFWSFGDLSRAGWREVGLLAGAVLPVMAYFAWNRWNYNALDAGDETARGLGARVTRVRWRGMLAASLLTAVIVASLGVIGFVGLICPHMVRRAIGDDHRFLLPGSCLTGAALLLAADVVSRQAFAPHQLPVSVLTACIGAPAFFGLLLRRGRP